MAQSRTNIWIDGAQAGGTLTDLKKKVNELNREIKDLPRNSDQYKKKVMELREANTALDSHRKQIRGVGDSLGAAKNGIGSMLKSVAPVAGIVGIASMAIGGITSAVSSWYNNNKQLEKSLSSLQSLTGASAEDLKFYKNEAVLLGKTTTLSATQVVDAYKLIGSAKPELLKNKEALNEVTKSTITLAEAAEMELGDSAQALAGTMNQFGLSAESADRIINALAAGSKEGAADINSLSQSIDKSGAVMNGYNVSVEEGIGLLETMAEKNIKGAEAGTQLRNVLLTMQGVEALPEKALKALEKYGVDTRKVADDTLPLQERLKEMSKISGDATAMMQVFGKENIVAGSTILKNVDSVQRYTEAVTGTSTAYEQAAINTNNLDGDMKSLGSAWEGLTLSLDGGSDVFRPLVQGGTSMLNWISDSIVAFKEWNTLDMETQFLKLMRNIPFVSSFFGDLIDQQIRLNEITSKVIDEVRKEGDQMMILTESLKQNKKALADKNTTAAEAARIEEENAKIIDVLNEKYPELAGNIDLTKVSASEMNDIQKQLNATIVQQAIETAKAAEQQRILEAIIADTIKQQRLQRDEQERGALGNWWASTFGETSISVREDIKKSSKELKNLDKDFEQVGKTVNSMDLQLGAEFKANGDMASKALKEMQSLVKQLEKTTDESQRKVLKSRIKGLEEAAKMGNKSQKEMLNGVLSSMEKIEQSEEDAAKASENAAKRKEEANKKAQDSYKKLSDALQKLLDSTENLSSDLIYKKRLDAIEDAQEKELFALEHSINEKYQKEIEAAEKLSKEKGEIGRKATEQLNSLLAIKEEDLQHERLQITTKFAKEKAAEEYEIQKQANLNWLKQQESLEQAVMDLKIAKAHAGVKAVSELDINARRAANEELRNVMIEQAEFEKQKRISDLQGLYAEEQINQEEFNLRKEQLELEHVDKIQGIHESSNEELFQMSVDRFVQVMDNISQIIDIASTFYEAAFNERMNQIDAETKKSQEANDRRLRDGIISEEEYTAEKERIEGEAEEKRKEAENQKAQKDKEMAIFQAIINTALGIAKAVPNPVLMALAAVAGAAQVALITSQPVPQYFDGGFHNVIGAKDGKNYRAKNIGRHGGGMLPGSPSLVLASEKGPEYFVPYHLFKDQRVANHVGAIEAIRTNQFADGGFTMPVSVGSGGDQMEAFLKANLQMLMQLNSKLPTLAVQIGEKDLEDMDDLRARVNQMRA
jgi:TP901 family phage tail tape measure protein